MLGIKLGSYSTLPSALPPQARDFLLRERRFHSSDKCAFRVLYMLPCPEEPDVLARKTKKTSGQTEVLVDHTASWWIFSSCTGDGGQGRRRVLNGNCPRGWEEARDTVSQQMEEVGATQRALWDSHNGGVTVQHAIVSPRLVADTKLQKQSLTGDRLLINAVSAPPPGGCHGSSGRSFSVTKPG